MITLIFASDRNCVIGNNGKLPWDKLNGDLKRFKEITTGHTVVMGRKTLMSLPNGQPLKSRRNIVMSRNITLRDKLKSFWYNITHLSSSLHFVDDINSLYLEIDPDDEVFVIGGAEIYKSLEHICHSMIWTKTHKAYSGDTIFRPSIIDWQLKQTIEFDEYELKYFRKKY